MSLFNGPQEHADNPPSTWVVRGVGPRCWQLTSKGGIVLDTYHTKRDAEKGKEEGFCARLYAQEARWYAGEPVPGWRPYAP